MSNATPQSTLVCPKCQGQMRAYERNGVTIDQCGDCRGIFLDRGELEALLDANDRYNASAGGETYNEPAHREFGEGGHHGSDRYDQRGRKRRGGFFGNFFDD